MTCEDGTQKWACHSRCPLDADVPALDFQRVVETLDRHDVQYLVVGGMAARGHGASRPTLDFDLVADRSKGNMERLAGALRELGARFRVEGLSDYEMLALHAPSIDAIVLLNADTLTFNTDAGPVDVLSGLVTRDGAILSFADLLPGAVSITVDQTAVRVAALADVIEAKTKANRPKDIEALPELDSLLPDRDTP
jgi:hypothetical protein